MPYTFEPIGRVRSPFTAPSEIPKGLGAEHRAEGVLEIESRFEAGLADIEGFSHLYVLWVFDRVDRVELTAWPPSDDRPHGVFATRSPQRPNRIGLTVVELLRRDGAACMCAASTCSTARPSSTSSRTSRAYRPARSDAGGSRRPRSAGGRPVERHRPIPAAAHRFDSDL